jgi:hypothetical protein
VDGGKSNKTGQVGENKQTTNAKMMVSDSWPSGQADGQTNRRISNL